MDVRINKTDFQRQVGSVHHTKRVRKPNKDEAEQDGERFADQLELVSQAGEQEEERSDEEQQHKTESQRKHAKKDSEDPEVEGPLGKHIDIKV